MPETSIWYLPQMENNSHHVELGPSSEWTKNLPIVKDSKQIMSYLHNKTHFKSANSLFMSDPAKKIDLADLEVCGLIQDMHKVVSRHRKERLKEGLKKMFNEY